MDAEQLIRTHERSTDLSGTHLISFGNKPRRYLVSSPGTLRAYGGTPMNGADPDQIAGADPSDRTAQAEIVIVQNAARQEITEPTLLRMLCFGIAGSIVADVVILIYFGLI
jgi:hypothetical protein